MSASEIVSDSAIKPQQRGKLPRWVIIVAIVVVVWLIAWRVFNNMLNLPLQTAQSTPFQLWLNEVNAWVGNNRDSSPLFVYFFDAIRDTVGWVASVFTQLFVQTNVGLQLPQIGWLGVVALVTWLAWLLGNYKVAILTAVGFLMLGLLGLWTESMATLALTFAAVFFSLLIGIPVGIAAGLSTRVERWVTPVLDFMQILPSFVYLAPLALLFSIGPASAVIATVIYAAPPVTRLTAHGIRTVPPTIAEAADSLGIGRSQRLWTVLLPLARRSIVIGINQTVMAALSMVTIAALIAAPGLGQPVLQGLQSLNVGIAFVAGLAIVIMAIVLDRVTTATGTRAEVAARSANPARKRARRIGLVIGLVITLIAIYLSRTFLWAAQFPAGVDIGGWLSDAVNSFSNWLQSTFALVTIGLNQGFTVWILNPFQAMLTQTPFVIVILVILTIALVFGGIKAAAVSAACLAVIVAVGLWEDSMITLASTIIATIATMILGIVVGVAMGRSARIDRFIRPGLDAAQTMPSFVYLVPFLGLFGASRFTAIVAAVIYAAPVAIKIIADGVVAVSKETVEAAESTGTSPWQTITKVQLPMSKTSLMLATNQGLIYVLAMVVIGGLVGAGALGYDVVAGFVQLPLFGKGLAAGIAIVMLGIMLDRITQAAAKRNARVPAAAGDTPVERRTQRTKKGINHGTQQREPEALPQ
ncbi:ABC transporter permease [Rathayibacter soli]|uniref:ABC transporter permease n=1 Tax=Rathayibacter soli TaxID=3144168 RepID=UPI0027E46B4E|nr:ABC transporter permease subunit [Glaciibacter superstes]